MRQDTNGLLLTVLVVFLADLGCGTYSDGYDSCYQGAFIRSCAEGCNVGYANGYQDGIGYRVTDRASSGWGGGNTYDQGCQDGTSDGRDDGYRFGADYCRTVGYRDAIEGWEFDFGAAGICADPGVASSMEEWR